MVTKLIPIDHGMSMPDKLEITSWDLVWAEWPQAEEPFSEKSHTYIKNIDVEADIEMLQKTFKFRPICLRNIKISTYLL